jgi:glutamate synthase (NADPH/NADH) large chain
MSGGVAYVFDPQQNFRTRCNLEMVELEPLADDSDLWLVRGLVEDHVRFTGSPRGKKLLDNWDHVAARFVKVMPIEYRRVLEQRRRNATRPPSLAVVGGS